MKDQADYSKYECPYSHIQKDCGHELNGPEGYQDVYGVWCACGFRGPVFCLDPVELNLHLKPNAGVEPRRDSDVGSDPLLAALDILQRLTDRTDMVLRGVAEQTELFGLVAEANEIIAANAGLDRQKGAR